MYRPKGKKLVYVPEDLLDAVAEIAKRKGESISKYVEDTLRQSVRTDQMGYSPEEVADIIEMVHVQRVLGGTMLPIEIMNLFFNERHNGDEALLQRWFDSGKKYGRYLKERFDDPVKAMAILLRTTRWDLNEVGIKRVENGYSLRCISTSLSDLETDILGRFIEGVLSGLTFEIKEKDVMRGFIRIHFST